MKTPLRGLSTVSFYASDLEEAAKWYSHFLNSAPYFRVQGYVEFRIGDYQHELGIIDSKYAPEGAAGSPAGAIVYWHVDNLQKRSTGCCCSELRYTSPLQIAVGEKAIS